MEDWLRELWPRHRRAILAGAAMLAVGLAIGLAAGRVLVPGNRAVLPAKSAAAPAQPAAPPAAALPGPTVTNGVTSDPPATETSPHTVVEDEPLVQPPMAAETRLAALPPPAPPPARRERPAWERFAVVAPNPGGLPMVAVIIDDMGLDRRRSERILQLPGPLTISFMSYAEELGRQTQEARAHGDELMMHVPMEPLGQGIDPGPGALLDRLTPEELRKRIGADLDRFTGYVGINNHMGSKFTAFAPGMEMLMEELHRRGLLFIDSLTTDHSVGLALARQAGVPTAGRNVFLDNEADVGAINGQLAKLEEIARKKGNAIAIGHPRDATIAALAGWLPTLRAKGLVLVPVTAVVQARQHGDTRYSRGPDTPAPPGRN